MKTAFKYITIYIVMSLSFHCGKYCVKEVRFELPITIQPARDIYKPGDTIWISMKISTELQDQISGEMINVGIHHFDLGMNILQLTDSSWTNGTQFIDLVPDIGNLSTYGFTFPEISPELVYDENLNIQEWRFGIIPKVPDINLVILFQKRNNFSWSGTYHFPQDDCDYFIHNSTFLTNNGNIDYQFYVDKYPYFTETGKDGNLVENHRAYGAFFFSVE